MFAQSRRKRQISFVALAVAMAIGSLFLAVPLFARVVSNTIDPLATVTDNGRHLVVTGPIVCTANERAYLEVTVTQRATGAVAYGRGRVTCTGGIGQWEVHASAERNGSFQEGPATAVALARTAGGGDITDAQQWLVPITLIGE